MTKEGYSDSLKELEKISEEIHQRRAERQKTCQKNNVKIREAGVGAENPTPSPTKNQTSKKGTQSYPIKPQVSLESQMRSLYVLRVCIL